MRELIIDRSPASKADRFSASTSAAGINQPEISAGTFGGLDYLDDLAQLAQFGFVFGGLSSLGFLVEHFRDRLIEPRQGFTGCLFNIFGSPQLIDKPAGFLKLVFYGFIDGIGNGEQPLTEGFKAAFFFSAAGFNFIGKLLEERVIQAAARHGGDGGEADVRIGTLDQEIQKVFAGDTGLAQFLEGIDSLLGFGRFSGSSFTERGVFEQRL